MSISDWFQSIAEGEHQRLHEFLGTSHDADGTILPDAATNALGGSIAAALRPHRPSWKRPAHTPVTIFQSGHGWTFTGTTDASSTLNDTSDFALGSQSAKLVTAGGGVGANLGHLALTSMDLSASYIVAWVKLTNVAHLFSLQMYVGDSSLANYYLCNVVIPSGSTAITDGEWIPIAFGYNGATQTGTPTKTAVTDLRFHAIDDNTGNKVTIQVNGVSIVPNASAFPNGVATIWWDDVYLDAYNSGRPYMDVYNYPGVCCPIIDGIGNGTYLTLAQLKSLQVNNGWQVVPHAYTQANHDTRFANLTPAVLQNEIEKSLIYLSQNGFENLDDFAWPGGIWGTDVNAAAEAVAQNYFRSGRLTTSNPRQKIAPAMPLRVGALNGQSLSLSSFETEIDRAYANGEWVNLVWHAIDADFDAKIDYLNSKGIPVKTAADVLGSL